MKMTRSAYGQISKGSVTSTAKLADASINAIAAGRDGYKRLYRLKSSDNGNAVYLRSNEAYDDMKATWGMKGGSATKACLSVNYKSCKTWASLPGHGLDLLHSSPGIGGQSCQRYFMGHGGLDCWPSNGGYRCVRGGGSCRHKGSFDGRNDHVVLNNAELWVHVNSCRGKNACSSNPCKNGGVCKNNGDYRFKCQCKKGWKGDHCEYSSKGFCQVFNGLAFAKVWQVNGRGRMKMTRNAVSIIDNGNQVTRTAKLDDKTINSMAKGRDGWARLYRLASTDNGNQAWIRTRQTEYNDMKQQWGFGNGGNTRVCLSNRYQSCKTWASLPGHGLDLLHSSPGIGGQSCQRY